ncbi:MAG: hypothetical protein J7L47_03780 [Candidatus Odinarchaeota archaeon]|nr:hypothetical protein [Candidatus Odinarchaeota archaeon]
MTEINHLTDIPGVGKILAANIVKHFGSEEKAIEAIKNGQITELASVSGLSQNKAISIVRRAYEVLLDVKLDDVLTTPDVRNIYDKIIELISQRYARTSYAKNKLFLYFPLPPSKLDIILERQRYFGNAKHVLNQISSQDLEEILRLLSNLKPLKKKVPDFYIRERAVLVDDSETHNELIKRGLDKYLPIVKLDEEESLADYLSDYSLILYISTKPTQEALSEELNLKLLLSYDENTILPELILFFFSQNLDTIMAMSNLASILQKYLDNEFVSKILSAVDFEKLESIKEKLSMIDSSLSIRDGIDEELDIFKHALANLSTVISEAEAKLNDSLKEKISQSDITLRGKDIINILESAKDDVIDVEQLRSYLPEEITDLILSEIEKFEHEVYDTLNLDETFWIEELFPRNFILPIEVDQRKVQLLENMIKREYHFRRHELLEQLAKDLKDSKSVITRAIQAFFELDLFLALGLFARDFELNVPHISNEYDGISFVNAKNIFLRNLELENKIKVQKISHVIGKTPYVPPETNGEKIVILSGANSGGKTTLLITLLQIAILAQTGFPVPAEEAYIMPFDEIYFYAKAHGMLDAGAFETSLKRLGALIVSPKKKLVCIDEWEAATEADAAAKIIAAVLDMFYEQGNSYVLFVSHLSERIAKLVSAKIRVDGIEAKGLDEHMNLIVDRNPKYNYHARSMPELILQRLSNVTKPPLNKVFTRILKLFSERRNE